MEQMGFRCTLLEITEVDYFFNYDFDYSKEFSNKLMYQFMHELKVDSDTENLIINLSIRYMAEEERLVQNTVRVVYNIPNVSDVVAIEGNKIQALQPKLLNKLLMTTIDIARGFLMKNLSQTPLRPCGEEVSCHEYMLVLVYAYRDQSS